MSDGIINSSKAPEPIGLYPHARRVGNLLFVSGVGPRERGTTRIPGVELNEAGEIVSYDIETQCRSVWAHDIFIDIDYCGICHSDIHQARNEWAETMPAAYPMVPGHEIVGRVSKVGSEVTKFAVGDIAGIGCFVDSCRECDPCKAG